MLMLMMIPLVVAKRNPLESETASIDSLSAVVGVSRAAQGRRSGPGAVHIAVQPHRQNEGEPPQSPQEWSMLG